MKKLISLVLALALMLCAVSALAAYPEKAVECTVPWGAGGGGDLAFRAFGDVWTKVTGQPYNNINLYQHRNTAFFANICLQGY